MPFRSPLLPLLRLRSSLERITWLRLRTIHTQIAATNAQLRDRQKEIVAIRTGTAERLRVGFASAQLTIDSVRAHEFEQARTRQLLDRLQRERHAAEQEFTMRRRERQVVENAVALEKARYEEERVRREQAEIDDATLQRINREQQAAAEES